MSYLFTSESVTEGHPDKLCDQVSDSLLDAFISQDPNSRVAVETLATTGLIVVAGEVTTTAKVDVQKVVRDTVKRIGYDNPAYCFDADGCAVLVTLHEQSPDISQGVNEGEGLHAEQGAGDQGLMFGFACDETPELMPLPITLAHKLSSELSRLRKEKSIPWLRPDGKTQVTVEYENNAPKRVHTIVVSTQHDPSVSHEDIERTIIEKLVKPVCGNYVDSKTIFHINPTGRFVIGGPAGDSGLTGRKIIVDTYGGYGAHGGGAFSGKDPSKVDRSAAYAARHIAKNIVAAKLAKRVEVQIAYAIGVAEPVSIRVDTKGTGTIADNVLEAAVKKVYKLTPKGIISALDLKKPIYAKTASGGHFGREEFSWEKLDKVEELKKAVAGF